SVPPPRPALFPYTTLFRSQRDRRQRLRAGRRAPAAEDRGSRRHAVRAAARRARGEWRWLLRPRAGRRPQSPGLFPVARTDEPRTAGAARGGGTPLRAPPARDRGRRPAALRGIPRAALRAPAPPAGTRLCALHQSSPLPA